MTRRLICILALALACAAAPAHADDGSPPEADVGAEPHPTEADGIARPEATPTSTKLLWIPRVLLFVPRWTLEVVHAPIRLGAYGYERYAVAHRLGGLFGSGGNLEAYPIIHVESGFGLSFGAKVAHTNLFGQKERLRFKGGAGGVFRSFYGVKLDSGERLGDLVLTAEFDLDFRGNARFNGYGNSDLTDELPPMPVDATDRILAVNTLYAQDTYRFELNALYAISDMLTTKISGAFINRTFGPTDDDDDPDISAAYDVDALTSFSTGVDQLYTELEVIFDNRKNTQQSRLNVAVPNAGWKLAGFGGHGLGLADDPTRFARFGIDIQRYTTLWSTDRILALRAFGETITGGFEDIPFMDLPSLGGSRELRGFFSDRFRDRAMGFVAAEFHFPVNLWMSSFVFTEVGRVFESVSDVTWRDSHVGFGIGMQVHSSDKFLFRGHMASSNEGGLLFHLSVDPVFRQKARTKRK